MNSYILLALGWLKDNVKHLGFPLAVLFCGLWLRGCGALAECQDKLKALPVKVETVQAAESKSDCHGKVKIVHVEVPAGDAVTPSWKPLPCPSVEVEFGANAEQVHWQSITATVVPVLVPRTPVQAFFSGAGYLRAPYLELGYKYKDFRVNGKYNLNQNPGFGFTYDWLAW
jgi:hypothetical protein